MPYQYVTEPQDYSNLASGRVFHSLPGHPAFPVRLASEIFQRSLARREALVDNATRCVLYDPCCGAAYHLAVLAYLHRAHIREVVASDIDENAVALANRNLALVSLAGLDHRIAEINDMIDRYGKESHKEALRSADTLRNQLSAEAQSYPLSTRVFRANGADRQAIANHLRPESVDIVFSDVPYGQHSHWSGTERGDPIRAMLDAMLPVLSTASIVALVSDKRQKVSHEEYQRIEHFQIGKRRVVLLRPS
jgi:uncharacterized small protein (DUF1192 family)